MTVVPYGTLVFYVDSGDSDLLLVHFAISAASGVAFSRNSHTDFRRAVLINIPANQG